MGFSTRKLQLIIWAAVDEKGLSLASNSVTITPDQRLLLHAALDEPDRALRCFSEWWGHVKLENTGSTEYRLLPLVHHNIGRLIPDATAAARIKGVAKHVWLSNHLNAALAATVLDRLNAANIPTVVVKGGAMMVAVSENNTRMMGDCDILVAIDQAPQALAAVEELGLTSARDIARFAAADYKILHGLPLVREGSQKALIDIHWRPFRIVGADELTHEFFEQSVPCVFSDQQTRRPGFPHMLLHVIVHGTEWTPVARYDWLADAALILRKAGSGFDWDMLADTAARYHLGSIVRRGLSELAQTFDALVPAKAFERLPRDSFIDRAEAKWRHRPPARMPVTHRSIMALQAFRRVDLELAGKPAWAALPEMWRNVFGPPSRSQMQPGMTADAEDHVIYLTGWHELEAGGRWTNGSLATLAIQQAPGKKGEFLRIVGHAMQATSSEPQVITIYSGWRRVARLTWGASPEKPCFDIIRLPPALHRREVLTLQFHIIKPTAPADVGPSEDIRQLGLFLKDIRTLSLYTRDAAETPLEFHSNSRDLAALWSGWSQPEAEGCWTDGPDASLRWTAPLDVPPGAKLVIRGIVFASATEALRGSISINGRRAGDFVQPQGAAVLSVPVVASPGFRDIHVQLRFENPKSPHELGLSSSDQRKLALFLKSISIET
jgi:hypothetical protein